MRKLLNKTVQPIALFSLALLIVSIPVYFLTVNAIWEGELDEHHLLTRNKIEKELNASGDPVDVREIVAQFNRLSLNSTIVPLQGAVPADSVYTHTRFDEVYGETESFRGFSSAVFIRGNAYVFNIETSIEESEETILVLAAVTFSFLVLLIAGIYFINWRLSKKIWKPFYATLEKLKSFDLSGEKDLHFDKSAVLEFEELNTAIGNLTAQNIRTYRRQKEFTENASHELQTPLALLKAKVDLLLQDGSLTKEQLESIAALDTSLLRATRINKNLLLLAKLDSRKIEGTKEQAEAGQLVDELLGFLETPIREKGIRVSKEYRNGFTVEADRNLLETLLLNLLLNAVKHNVDNGSLHVSLDGHVLTVSNSGTHTLNTESLYKRFASASQTSPGSGLGLAIAKEIAEQYNWKLSYSFRDGLHSFSVAF